MKIEKLKAELSEILQEIIDKETSIDEKLAVVQPNFVLSAKNLLRYLILRSKDLRKYHDTLSDLGISSLRTTEGYVYTNLYNVVRNLSLLEGTSIDMAPKIETIGYSMSKKLIKSHSNALFKENGKKYKTKIMVTLPNEVAEDKVLLKEMVSNGMEIARINLSHGNLVIWEKMISLLKDIEEESGQRTIVYMDLSGPKLRTAEIEIRNRRGKVQKAIPIKKGDRILLTKSGISGEKISAFKNNSPKGKAEIGVMQDEVIDDARAGDLILFDDGMIRSRVVSKSLAGLEVEITEAYKHKLGSHKGINLPDTKLNMPSLTAKDLADLPFICKNADIVGYSFVRTSEDVAMLYSELEKHDTDHLGVVLKIENKEAFENLPEILLKGMERSQIGVMIARGDLAVELGFERISEVQNQILWLCEAAHVPVIWATQVLENLAKTGIPTRAEISDATLASQAECVMLNKGPYIINAIQVLGNILQRMEGHSFKKKSELRPLQVAQRFVNKL